MTITSTIHKRLLYSLIVLLVLASAVVPLAASAQQLSKSDLYIEKLATAKNYKDSVKKYCTIAHLKNTEEQMDESRFYAFRALKISLLHNDTLLSAKSYFQVAQYFYNTGKYDSAKYYAQQCTNKYDAANNKGLYYTYAVNMIGTYYLYKGDAAKALKYAHRQMDVAIERKDTVSISNSYTMLAAVYDLLGDVDMTLRYTKKALELNRLSGQIFNRAVVLSNVAQLYIQKQKTDSAIPLLFEMLDVATNHYPSSRDKGMAYMYLGNCYTINNNFDSALHYLNKAKPEIMPLDEPKFSGTLLLLIADAYRAKKHYDTALFYLDNGINKFEKGGLVTEQLKALQQKSETLAEMGRYKEAYSAYQKYRTSNDSIANADVQKKIAQLREQYESEQKDALIVQQQKLNKLLQSEALLQKQQLQNEILLKQTLESKNILAQQQIISDSIINTTLDRENMLKKTQLAQAEKLNLVLAEDNRLREADLRKERIINSLLIGGFFIVLLSAGLAFAQYRKQKAANRTIQEQSNKLTLLMKELHHRVKNNLQIISSLLSLQSFRIKDAAASKAVREGQQRIEAMSLIHQRLYTRDNLTEINVKEFITDLVDSLQSAYGYHDDDIAISLNIANERMNVDQAIPLSLIINELVTNVFKYACEDNSHPELSIKLNRENGKIHLFVADNGKGLDIEQWKEKEGSFGKELIKTFVKQLNGSLAMAVNNGTQFKLTIPSVT